MEKRKYIYSTLLLSLFATGCTSNLILTDTNQEVRVQHQQREIIQHQPIQADNYHQLKTIQGPVITVGTRRNGFTFPQYPGKVVLLQIFGKECPYCFEELPVIANIHRQYAQKLNIVAIQAQDPMSKNTASRLINRFQMYYPIIERDNASELLLFLSNTYGWTGILPYTLLIKNGVTEYSFSGQVDKRELEEAVRSLI